MSYTTPDLVENTINLNRESRENFTDEDVNLVEHLRDTYVDPKIDAQLASEYDVPFSNVNSGVPEIIRSISTKMTAFLFVAMPGSQSQQFDSVEQLWNDAQAELDLLESGDMTIHELQTQPSSGTHDFDRIRSEAYYSGTIFRGDFDPDNFGNYHGNLPHHQ